MNQVARLEIADLIDAAVLQSQTLRGRTEQISAAGIAEGAKAVGITGKYEVAVGVEER